MAVVVGMPVEILGETPVAFVVPRAGCEIDSADTCAWANGRLEPHQRLFLVKVVESLPINDMGKVSRQGLLAEFTN
jgi:acyl-coenzyme A synthetase/AMP-(fatty) acid ligase